MALVLGACGGTVSVPVREAETAITPSAVALAQQAETPFSDVPADAWYAAAVDYVNSHGIMTGTDKGFEPDSSFTRAQVATVFYRMAGEPTVTGEDAFTDTQPGRWYSNAVTWANDTGLVQGYGNGRFGTEDPVTQEQLVTILHRYAGEPTGTADAADVAPWYQNAISWARSSGLIGSELGYAFAHGEPANRSQVAAILYRYLSTQEESQPAPAGNKVLVAYFSATGHTKPIAEYVAKALDADLYEITPETPYTSADLNYSDSASRSTKEQNDSTARPAIAGKLPDLSNYSAVILGHPIWWGQAPKLLYTFVESYDWTGKTVATFCTSGSSGVGTSASNLLKSMPGATLLDSRRFSAGESETNVTSWAKGLDLPKAETVSNASTASGKPAVYFTSDITPEGLVAVYDRLNWNPTGKVAVKVSTGEPPASNYLRAELIGDLVKKVDGTIVECNTAYGGSRASSAMHKQVAEDHGFTSIADFDLMDEEGEVSWPVTGGDRLDRIIVGSHAENYQDWLILSHYKGHAMAGFGGAIKNVGIGCSSASGKVLVHTAGTKTSGSIWYSDQDAWLEALAEMVDGFVDHVGQGHIVYVNVMNRLSVDCDCNGNPAEPDIHDIGILASADPVALDQACCDLVAKAEGNTALMNRIDRQHGLHTLEHAQEVGLGSREYTLVDIG